MNGLEWFMIIISIIFFFLVVGYYMSNDKKAYINTLGDVTFTFLGAMADAAFNNI